jgi:hypothetical protein
MNIKKTVQILRAFLFVFLLINGSINLYLGMIFSSKERINPDEYHKVPFNEHGIVHLVSTNEEQIFHISLFFSIIAGFILIISEHFLRKAKRKQISKGTHEFHEFQ